MAVATPVGGTRRSIPVEAERVLRFWFGHGWFAEVVDDAQVIAENGELWFNANAAVDGTIRRRFGALREAAIAGDCETWLGEPHAALALIVLIDQFSRNIFRGDARAFAHDALARYQADTCLAHRGDASLSPIGRVFLYLPFEHSESLDDQRRSIALFSRLRDSVTPALRSAFSGYLDYATRHHDVIARFGRFPHRNAALGRVSTPAETAFLSEPGSSF